ncbi:UNVERIFIED_CONTAM: hypothetical protein Slati_0450700 [Sesamum latifolium]|uniref:Uncharacterized protein n=1 Tax=Sesamum latifolium TaxID=2727402 RepID=A0AAW2Y0G2_9LAMI
MATDAATETIEGASAGTSNAPQRRGSEALQLHSSDHPGIILVSTPLDGKKFPRLEQRYSTCARGKI